jgi:hypothetical protein
MLGRKPRAAKTMSDDELRSHVLAVLEMTNASTDGQDAAVRRVRSIARKRFATSALRSLPRALARDVQEMRDAGASEDSVTDFVVRMMPDSDAQIRVLMQKVAAEASSM